VPTLLHVDAETPRSLIVNPPLTDAQFEALCAAEEWFRLERTREGEILMNPPAGGFTSAANFTINGQLYNWWKTHGGGRVYDATGGFHLADTSILNPDAAYIGPQKLKGLTKDKLTGFPRLCPDFVVELLSKSDSVPRAKQKMERWIENGAALGWLIDPYKKQVHVYASGRKVSTVKGKTVQGSGPVEGFLLDLDELWRCYEI
jgi:Uma2 family endonuclease